MHIVMIAAENAALRGGKAGGVGDVIRDVPLALAKQGHQVSVITPGYQKLALINDSKRLGTVNTVFCSEPTALSLYRLEPAEHSHALVNHYVLDHPVFAACGAGAIYCHDEAGPFATDAHKFVLFCTAVCEFLIADDLHKPDVLHLHDWHASMVAVLRQFHPRYQSLRPIRTVFTIHNLALQGIRPVQHNHSSLEHWHPELLNTELWHKHPRMRDIIDPRYPDCINLMRCGLLLSDMVHAVSPGYCEEILKPSDPQTGFIGGEGLERDLQMLAQNSRLAGILNGCMYSDQSVSGIHKVNLRDNGQRRRIFDAIQSTMMSWAEQKEWIPSSSLMALHRIMQWRQRRKPFPVSLLSIGRLTDQKFSLLRCSIQREGYDSETALEHILHSIGDGIYILVGTGDYAYEQFFSSMMEKHQNFIYLQGFSEQLADLLYGAVDLFLMPSSFEPCGISQMLAMRAGTPCIVHGTGGLKNTVTNNVTGFVFNGDSAKMQATNMLQSVNEACRLVRTDSDTWHQIQTNAGSARFLWDDSIRQYMNKLYTAP